MSINYQDGKIYEIINLDDNKKYIGATVLKLSQRLANHVQSYNKYLAGKYQYDEIYDLFKSGNYEINLVELFPCHSKEELNERKHVQLQKTDCINKNEKFPRCFNDLEYAKQYYQKNKDIIREKQKNTMQNIDKNYNNI